MDEKLAVLTLRSMPTVRPSRISRMPHSIDHMAKSPAAVAWRTLRVCSQRLITHRRCVGPAVAHQHMRREIPSRPPTQRW